MIIAGEIICTISCLAVVDCLQIWESNTPVYEHACSSCHGEVQSISFPFWSSLALTCFDQSVAKVTLGQWLASLLRCLSASWLQLLSYSLGARYISWGSTTKWWKVRGERIWRMTGHLGWPSSSRAPSWMPPHEWSQPLHHRAGKLPNKLSQSTKLREKSELLF